MHYPDKVSGCRIITMHARCGENPGNEAEQKSQNLLFFGFVMSVCLGLFRVSHLFLASGFIPLSFHIAYYVAYVMNSPGYFPLSA